MPDPANRLDQLDIALLGHLQRDNQLTADELAERVGRSASAVARRIRRLRETKAIVADVSIVGESVIPQSLSAVIHVQLERHELKEFQAFRRELVASENVQQVLEISGTYDIILLVVVRDMDAFNEFADSTLASARAVARYETSFVKRRVKSTSALPLDQLQG